MEDLKTHNPSTSLFQALPVIIMEWFGLERNLQPIQLQLPPDQAAQGPIP